MTSAGTDHGMIVTAHPGIDFAAIAVAVPTVDLRGVTRRRRVNRPVQERIRCAS